MAYNASGFGSDAFDTLLGGDDSVNDVTSDRKGVYAQFPAATPKYSTTNDDRSLQTQARLLIPLPDSKTLAAFLHSYAGYSTDVQQLAKTIAVAQAKQGGSLLAGAGYIDFLLTSAQESFEEKLQVHDVLGDNFVAYFFGQRPPLFSYQGVLMNTEQDDWRLAMLLIYSNIARGTQLARRGTTITLSYDNLAITGAMANMTQNLTAEMQMASPFAFQMLVKRIDIYRTPGAVPTQLIKLPYVVQPDMFATQVNVTTQQTMRTITSAQSTTDNRIDTAAQTPDSKEEYVTQQPSPPYGATSPTFGQLMSTPTITDAYGMPVSQVQ